MHLIRFAGQEMAHLASFPLLSIRILESECDEMSRSQEETPAEDRVPQVVLNRIECAKNWRAS